MKVFVSNIHAFLEKASPKMFLKTFFNALFARVQGIAVGSHLESGVDWHNPEAPPSPQEEIWVFAQNNCEEMCILEQQENTPDTMQRALWLILLYVCLLNKCATTVHCLNSCLSQSIWALVIEPDLSLVVSCCFGITFKLVNFCKGPTFTWLESQVSEEWAKECAAATKNGLCWCLQRLVPLPNESSYFFPHLFLIFKNQFNTVQCNAVKKFIFLFSGSQEEIRNLMTNISSVSCQVFFSLTTISKRYQEAREIWIQKCVISIERIAQSGVSPHIHLIPSTEPQQNGRASVRVVRVVQVIVGAIIVHIQSELNTTSGHQVNTELIDSIRRHFVNSYKNIKKQFFSGWRKEFCERTNERV